MCQTYLSSSLITAATISFVLSIAVWANLSLECVSNCSALLKHSLGSIIGGQKAQARDTELLAPLHTLILGSASYHVVNRKVQWICHSVDKFKECADECSDNRQKLVELANVGHWAVICEMLFTHPKTFSEFVICQRKHLDLVRHSCQPLPTNDTGQPQGLKAFCRNMSAYAKCYERLPQRCSANATKFYQQITASIALSFSRIRQISRGHLSIPEDCLSSFGQNASTPNGREWGRSAEDSRPVSTSSAPDYWMDAEEPNGTMTSADRQVASNARTLGWPPNGPLLLLKAIGLLLFSYIMR